jgi:transcriptional regulator with XRE-family HTH domain
MDLFKNLSWEFFVYGNTCNVEEMSRERSKNFSKRNINFDKLKIPAGTLASTASTPPSQISLLKSTSTNLAQLTSYKYYSETGKRVRLARNLLSLTLEETASLLNISLSALQKLEGGDTQRPTKELLDQYLALIDLAAFLKRKLKGRKFVIVPLLRTPLTAFGDKTALAFAKVMGNEGIHRVLGVLKRIYE